LSILSLEHYFNITSYKTFAEINIFSHNILTFVTNIVHYTYNYFNRFIIKCNKKDIIFLNKKIKHKHIIIIYKHKYYVKDNTSRVIYKYFNKKIKINYTNVK